METRLHHAASASFLYGSDGSLSHPARWWLACGRGRHCPRSLARGSFQLWRVVTVETSDFVFGSRKKLECFYRVVGCVCSFWVDCEPLSASIAHCQRDGGDWEVWVSQFAFFAQAVYFFKKMVASYLGAEFPSGFISFFGSVGFEHRICLSCLLALHLGFWSKCRIKCSLGGTSSGVRP